MRKALPGLIFLIIVLCSLSAQDTQVLLNTFRRNFAKSEQLEIKLQVLKNAAQTGSAGLGALYLDAVDYALNNSSLLLVDTLLKEIAVFAITQIKETGFTDAKNSLWRLFREIEDTSLRINILEALGVIAKDDMVVIENVTNWLDIQNNLFLSGSQPDIQVVMVAVKTLGVFRNNIAFPILFTTIEIKYSDQVSQLAEQALLSLKGDFKENLRGIINNGELSEKLSALKLALKTDRLTDIAKAEVAELALEVSIYTTTRDVEQRAIARDIRFTSVVTLGNAKWSKATTLVIEHFGMTLLEYDRGIIAKPLLLDSIEALGNMGTHEAAERLTLYLELLNSYTEHRRAYDEQIIISVLNNLKKLGDKVAFANLSYTQYLSYSDTVKKAAKDAINNLKW